jgi:hypothetical protein
LPAVQADGVEWDTSQAIPQPPQLVVVVIDVSQPFTSTPELSQLRYPAEHPE